jgi:MoxR-like ATPase
VPLAGSLVGRDLELQVVRGMVRDVRAGQAEVLLIEGEAGIGKSRLVQSLIAEAYAVGAVVFCGRGPSVRADAPVRRGRRCSGPAAALA